LQAVPGDLIHDPSDYYRLHIETPAKFELQFLARMLSPCQQIHGTAAKINRGHLNLRLSHH
jgi:hypothetical protein